MKRILVATDFSSRSDRAIWRASQLAKQFDAALTIVHAIDDDKHSDAISSEKATSEELLANVAKAIRMTDGIECDARAVLGSAFDVIVRTGEAINADITVIGQHRRHVLRDIFIGTTAERIIRANTPPTLMANAMPAGAYRNILVAVDLSDCSGEALRGLTRLGLHDGTRLSVLYVFDTSITRGRTGAYMSHSEVEKHLASIQARAKADLSSFLVDWDFDPSAKILRPNDLSTHYVVDMVARDISADLIILGTHGRSGFMRFALGSVARDVLAISECDVLVVPPSTLANVQELQNSSEHFDG